MTKNSFKQTNSIIIRLLSDNRREMFLHPSHAQDSGTIKRNAQYFITKMGNKTEGISEYSDIMIMFDLIGVQSLYSMHGFQLCNIWAALHHQRILHANLENSSEDFNSDTNAENIH